MVGVQLKLLPVLATAPDNADPLTQIRFLLLPAVAMAIVYFGYIARMTRAGAIERRLVMAPISNVADVDTNEHLAARCFFEEVEHPVDGRKVRVFRSGEVVDA